MKASLVSVSALLIGATILLIGNGLQGVLIPVRASLEGFATSTIGAVASAYSLGFMASCLLSPRVVQRVGHIRTFAAFAAMAASLVLLMALAVQPLVWVVLRVVSGFCFAGLFMVIESWLAERSSNENRGQIFAVYMLVNLGAVTGGQLLLPVVGPLGFLPFIVTCIAITWALVPVSLTTSQAPAPIHTVRLRLGRLYRMSPVGVVGCLFVGIANSSLGGLGPVFAQGQGLSITGVALFMSASLLGGALVQLPLGKLSDRIDRRWVMVGCCTGAALIGLLLVQVGGVDIPGGEILNRERSLPVWGLIGLMAVAGCFFYPLYALCVAHTNDFVAPEEFMEASSGLLLTYGLGAAAGPMLASLLMEAVGPGGLFLFTASIHLGFALFALYRMARRARPAEAERGEFIQATPTVRITPTLLELDPRVPEHTGETA